MPALHVLNRDEEIPLRGKVTLIGRDPASDVVVGTGQTSWRHAIIVHGAAGYVIEDLDSVNGTFVNGRRVTERTLLHPNDRIDVSGLSVVFRGDAPATVRAVEATVHVPMRTEPGMAEILSALDVTTGIRAEIKPEAKLRAVLEISKQLSAALDLHPWLHPAPRPGHQPTRAARCPPAPAGRLRPAGSQQADRQPGTVHRQGVAECRRRERRAVRGVAEHSKPKDPVDDVRADARPEQHGTGRHPDRNARPGERLPRRRPRPPGQRLHPGGAGGRDRPLVPGPARPGRGDTNSEEFPAARAAAGEGPEFLRLLRVCPEYRR